MRLQIAPYEGFDTLKTEALDMTVFDFMAAIFPKWCYQYAQPGMMRFWTLGEVAMYAMLNGEMFRCRWWPPHDTVDHKEAESLYYHATSLTNLRHIRWLGLQPSPVGEKNKGIGSERPVMYTGRKRNHIMWTYGAPTVSFPNSFGEDKLFMALLGVKGEFAQRCKGDGQKGCDQWLFDPNTYEIVSLEIHCVAGGAKHMCDSKLSDKKYRWARDEVMTFLVEAVDQTHLERKRDEVLADYRPSGPPPPARCPGRAGIFGSSEKAQRRRRNKKRRQPESEPEPRHWWQEADSDWDDDVWNKRWIIDMRDIVPEGLPWVDNRWSSAGACSGS